MWLARDESFGGGFNRLKKVVIPFGKNGNKNRQDFRFYVVDV